MDPSTAAAYEIDSLTWTDVVWLRRLCHGTAIAPRHVEKSLSTNKLIAIDIQGGLVLTTKGLRFLEIADPNLRTV